MHSSVIDSDWQTAGQCQSPAAGSKVVQIVMRQDVGSSRVVPHAGQMRVLDAPTTPRADWLASPACGITLIGRAVDGGWSDKTYQRCSCCGAGRSSSCRIHHCLVGRSVIQGAGRTAALTFPLLELARALRGGRRGRDGVHAQRGQRAQRRQHHRRHPHGPGDGGRPSTSTCTTLGTAVASRRDAACWQTAPPRVASSLRADANSSGWARRSHW